MSRDLLPLPIGLHGLHRDKGSFTLPSIIFICYMLRITFEITSDTISSAVIAKCFDFYQNIPLDKAA
jgi:hypothetical protein